MPSYDLVYIVRPDLDAEATSAVVERATQRLVDQGATVEHTEAWGKRRMAYPIQRYREGHYVFTRFSVPGDRIPGIRHGLKIIEDVLRASITVAVGPVGSARPAAAPAPAAVAVEAPAPQAPGTAQESGTVSGPGTLPESGTTFAPGSPRPQTTESGSMQSGFAQPGPPRA